MKIKERPILFSAPMIQAILAGRKTQTRRALRVQPPINNKPIMPLYTMEPIPAVTEVSFHEIHENGVPYCSSISRAKCPYGKVGDQLWVRETFGTKIRNVGGTPHESFTYKADNPDEIQFYDCNGNGFPVKWVPSIHMPRSASRIQLEITSIRVEQLLSISESDCVKEGIGSSLLRDCKRPKFMRLWEEIHGEGSCLENPWVWVVEFKVINGGTK